MKLAGIFLIVCFVITISCSSVSSVKVDYRYDPEAAFTSFRSYDWLPVPRKSGRYELIVKQIRGEVNRNLKVNGFEMMHEGPDFLIALHGGVQPRLDFIDWEYLIAEYEEYSAKRRQDFIKYEDGTLIFDFIDAKEKTLIYRAEVNVYISIEPNPIEREKKIKEAVNKALEKFIQLAF